MVMERELLDTVLWYDFCEAVVLECLVFREIGF